jgi:phospholipid N-methyltransferase
VTGLLIENLRPGDELLLCEINSVFADHLQDRLSNDPKWREHSSQVRLHRGDIREVLEPGAFHAVVSGLPLNNFPSSLVAEIVQGFLASLRPGGVHTFFEYAWLRGLRAQWGPKRDRERLREIGAAFHKAFAGQILSRRLIFWNFPPAWAYSVSPQ